MAAFTLTDEQQVSMAIAPKTKKGNPAKVDGVPAWSSSAPDILTVTPAADGMSAVAVAVGPVGTAQVTVSADADLGAGTKPITGIQDFEVVAASAASVGITVGAAEDQPDGGA